MFSNHSGNLLHPFLNIPIFQKNFGFLIKRPHFHKVENAVFCFFKEEFTPDILIKSAQNQGNPTLTYFLYHQMVTIQISGPVLPVPD